MQRRDLREYFVVCDSRKQLVLLKRALISIGEGCMTDPDDTTPTQRSIRYAHRAWAATPTRSTSNVGYRVIHLKDFLSLLKQVKENQS